MQTFDKTEKAESVPAELVTPDDGAYLIHYDDKDCHDEVFAGAGALNAALYRYEQISDNWNARLFVMIDSNCGDTKAVRAAYGREQGGWQPMETAPKDGREVLLEVDRRAGCTGKTLVGHWMPGGHCIEDHPPIVPGWYFWTGNIFDEDANPIRWAPLPLTGVQHADPDGRMYRQMCALDQFLAAEAAKEYAIPAAPTAQEQNNAAPTEI